MKNNPRAATLTEIFEGFRTPVLYGLVIIIIVLCAVGGITFALMTDSETIVNVFTIGEVAIELSEPEWEADVIHITYPGRTFSKDPLITNTGKNNAAVFIEVLIPRAEVRTYCPDCPEIVNPAEETDLFTFTPNSGWLWINNLETDPDMPPVPETVTEDDIVYSRYIYGYFSEIEPGITTVPLFDSVEFIHMIEGEIQMGSPENIIIRGYAVQHMSADFEEAAEESVILFQLQAAFELFETSDGEA